MKLRYRLFQRSSGIFFVEDRISKKQESLKTRDKIAARLWLRPTAWLVLQRSPYGSWNVGAKRGHLEFQIGNRKGIKRRPGPVCGG